MIPLLLFSSHVVLAAQPEESDEISQNVVRTGASDWGTQGSLRASNARRLTGDVGVQVCNNAKSDGECEYWKDENTSFCMTYNNIHCKKMCDLCGEPEVSNAVTTTMAPAEPEVSNAVPGCSSEKYLIQEGDYILKLAHDRRCDWKEKTIFFKSDCKEDSWVTEKDELVENEPLYFAHKCTKYETDKAILQTEKECQKLPEDSCGNTNNVCYWDSTLKKCDYGECSNKYAPAEVKQGEYLKKLAGDKNCDFTANTYSSRLCEPASAWYNVNKLEVGDKLYFGKQGCGENRTPTTQVPEIIDAHAPNADPTPYPEFMVSGVGGVVQQGRCTDSSCSLTNTKVEGKRSAEDITWIAPHPTDDNIVYAVIEKEVKNGEIGIQKWTRSGAVWNLTVPSVKNAKIKHTPVHATSTSDLVFVSFLCWRCKSTNLVTVHDANTLEYKYAIMGPGGSHGAFVYRGYLYIAAHWAQKVCWVSLTTLRAQRVNIDIDDLGKKLSLGRSGCVDTDAPPRHIAFRQNKAYVACEVPAKDNELAPYSGNGYNNLHVYDIDNSGKLSKPKKMCLSTLNSHECGTLQEGTPDYLGEILVIGDYLYISNRVFKEKNRNVIYEIPLPFSQEVKKLKNAPFFVRSMHAKDNFLVAAGEKDNKLVLWELKNNGQVKDDMGKEVAKYDGKEAKFVMLS